MRCVRVAAIAWIWLAAAVPARAQTPSNYDLVAGYQFLRNDGENLRAGGYVNFSFHLESGVHVVASGDMRLTSFLTGIGVAMHRESRVVPFVQLLAGYVHGSASATGTATFGGRTVTTNESTS